MAEVKTQKIILKRSSIAGKIPTADQLDPGELAINLADGLLTSKDTSDNIIDLNSFDRKLSGYSNDGTIKGEITSKDSIKTALSKIENNIIDDEKVTSESLNDLNSSKVDKSSVSSSNPTLSFGGTSKIGSVDGKDFKVTMPANPNTDTKVTSAANHYSPTSVTYTPTVGSAVTWGGAVVTGITKDDKGHIVGVTTGTIPGSPSSTTYTFANGSDGSFTVTPSSGTAQKVNIGKPSTAGTSDVANRTNSALTVKVKSGTTEGVDQYTFNGSSAKSLDIKAGTNVSLLAEEGSITISSTNTDTKYSAGTGLSLSGTTFNHSNSVTVGTDVSGTGNVSNTVGTAASISIPYFSYDAQGHITKSGTKTLTINTEKNTDTHYTSKNIVGASATASANAAASNGSVFINHLESNSTTPTSSHKIIGSGATTVVSDASGNITINSTNTTYNVATTTANGLMSSSDKTKLDGVATGANNYSLPTATGSVLGGVKTGSNITNSSGTISLTKANVVAALGYTPPTADSNTTYTFANGTNGFTVTPSGGSAQTITVTPSIANNVTGSGTSGYIAKFSGANTVTNGPALGSSTTTFLRNDGTWATPAASVQSSQLPSSNTKMHILGVPTQGSGSTYTDSKLMLLNNSGETSLLVGGTSSDNGLVLSSNSIGSLGLTLSSKTSEIYLKSYSKLFVNYTGSDNGFGDLVLGPGDNGVWISNSIVDNNTLLTIKSGYSGSPITITHDGKVNATTGFFQTSDKRLKENIVDLESSLDKISKIPTVNFNYISDEDKRAQIGTIADEVEEVFPELVSKGSDGYKTVDYSKFSIIALSAIKELSKKVDELSKKVNGL